MRCWGWRRGIRMAAVEKERHKMHNRNKQKNWWFHNGFDLGHQAWHMGVWAAIVSLIFFLLSALPAYADNPSFDETLISPLAENTKGTAVGDLDGDGDLDVVVGNECDEIEFCFTDPQSWVYLNDGSGNFNWSGSAIALGASGERTYSVAVGDMNGDGYLDIVTGNLGTNRVYLNDGDSDGDGKWDGTFTTQSFASGSDTISLALGDLNGDGHLDVAVANFDPVNGYPEFSEIYINDGSGSLSLAGNFGPEYAETIDIALADLDGDGFLDIAAVHGYNPGRQNAVYLNDGEANFWSSSGNSPDCTQDNVRCLGAETRMSRALAIGDLNGDGSLDVVVVNQGAVNDLYLNDGAGNFPTGSTFGASGSRDTVTLADMDGDGDLDVVDGDTNVELYLNNGSGSLGTPYAISSSFIFNVGSLSPVDVDGDGDLDIVSGNTGANLVHVNDGAGNLSFSSLSSSSSTESAAVGDMNADGHLDIVIGRYINQDRVYLNDGSGGFGSSYTFGPGSGDTNDLAVGDLDGDGLLDIVAADDGVMGAGDPVIVHLNNGDDTFTSQYLSYCDECITYAVALGDLDSDDDLDIVVGSQFDVGAGLGGPNVVYLNDGGQQGGTPGTFVQTIAFGSGQDYTHAVALGDLDGDGDLDVAVGNCYETEDYGDFGYQDVVYLNDGAGNLDTAINFGTGEDKTYDLALGDVDGDGDLDIVTGNIGPDVVYLNDGAAGFDSVRYFGPAGNETRRVAVGDVNGDGALDLAAAGVYGGEIYLNEGTGQFDTATPSRNFGAGIYGLALGDLDVDGTLDVVAGRFGTSRVYFNPLRTSTYLVNNLATPTVSRPGSTPDADFYSTPEILADTEIPISFTLFDVEGDSVRAIEAYYSFNGGGTWVTAVPTNTITTDLPASASGTVYTFTWDTFQSGFFGQSDNVVFRLETWPSVQHPVRGVPGPFLWPYAATVTFPFRVRGTQVRVLSDTLTGTVPVAGAIVYRLPAGQSTGALPIGDEAGQPYETDVQGYLQGRGQVDVGDTLFALLPITATDVYTLYYTSGTPTETGLDGHVVQDPGIQTLVVSADNPLLLFNLDLSLEWDARNDGTFLDDLETAIQRASEVLYDVSDGQMALGTVRVNQGRESWIAADVVMYAQNGIRPRASMGGVAEDLTDDMDRDNVTISNAYGPGQVRVGPNWDPFGQSLDELSQDWQRALAHELSHYLLYLPDNYFGVGEEGVPINTDCQGSFMTSTYDDAYSEFLTRPPWEADDECLQTVAEHTTGRADWQTIQTFYDMLISPTLPLDGPSLMPLGVTKMVSVSLETPAETLAPTFFDVRDSQTFDLLSVSRAQGYLFKTQGTGDGSDDQVIGLGSTVGDGDRVKVRGAEPGDRLCLFGPFDESTQSSYAGCIESLTENDRSIPVSEVADWQPHIIVTAITSRTMAITLTLPVSASDLYVQVCPAYGAPTSTIPVEAPWAAMLPLAPAQAYTFSQVITLDYPAFEALVRVWVPGSDPVQEALSQVYLSPPWGPNNASFGMGGNARAWGANQRLLGAPVASGDGQVTIFNLEDIFADTGTVSLQALNDLPGLPLWLTPVGQGYRFVSDEVFPRAMVLNYLQRDVPEGYEHTLYVYYSPDEGATWLRLATERDTDHNQATAQMPDDEATSYGQGIYAVLSTIDMPSFQEGWNQFGYPLPGTREVTLALASIEGAYTSVYYYDSAAGRWRLHDATVLAEQPEYAGLVNDLAALEFGRSYWLYATEAITLYLGVPEEGEQGGMGAGQPPATFYGPISPAEGFTPTVGMVVTATVEGVVCGSGVVSDGVGGGSLAYAIQVVADTGDGCGAPGRTVLFAVGGQTLAGHGWDNSRAWYYPLTPQPVLRFYLPLIFKDG